MAESSRQLPSNMVAREFGEVNIRPVGTQLEVTFTIAMEPQGVDAEGWQTGVALDASGSMREWFGQSLKGSFPPEALAEYRQKGWVYTKNDDGRSITMARPEAYEDGLRRGYLKNSENIIQPLAREFIGYLAENLDADGGTTVIYWACGNGGATEVLGDFTAQQCRELVLEGPKSVKFGDGTQLLPALKYFVERFSDAARGMYLFLTDGRLDDLDAIKRYTRELAQAIANGNRNPVKCVLVGVGSEIDASQMEQLDDLDTGTDVDIWDHKIAQEMRSLVEIFAEVVDENQLVAPMGRIFDSMGKQVKNFPDGLPAKVTFTMPRGSQFFELEVGGERIRQSVVML
ncbi:vWA domain-containing protein [Tuwongella immobilis]|uniref:VWFA domain-containing protein n=1 Tax=Tuwongella immobilis TaxID=692036 RepID=A0A6C2YSA7_9BACT|nr:vWA domain-containing protein [Tuwongella immobilis]VIP04234.1 Putative uncharacterized protein OS=Arthrospira sp. PCC 8005 GN=ARTHRO_560018 PE=4 SV=1 [Tuwongella immobilis]VTS05832.1 Putative uncharacterized protein OS=Arthrospira sp. PCC 8005 GN=ARTHRO_560018 PE=4 SV=1 [Tuwongella immobilis]